MASGPSSCHRIIFRKLPDPIPEVEGPRGWPELKWGVRHNNADYSSGEGEWICCSVKPVLHKTRNAWWCPTVCVFAFASSVNWTPPPEIADLPPEKSLVKLTHECRWVADSDKARVRTSCGTFCDIGFTFNFCPNCGRNVVMGATSTA